jgi:hypothetical protein
MRSKPKISARESRAARSGWRAGSHPRTRRSLAAARADAMPLGRNSGALRHIGGSQSDDSNDLIAAETVQALCVRDTDGTIDDGQIDAGISRLVGIAPRDETEGMMAAQPIAAHSAVMECYRRAMIDEEPFRRERDENLRHANRLSRNFVLLQGALQQLSP